MIHKPLNVLLYSLSPTLQQAPINPHLRWRLLDTSGQVWVSLSGVTAPFPWVLVHTRFCLCSPRVYFPVLCKFWQLHVGVNGDLLQEGLCHTQACCTQNPHPCGSPLLTCTSTRDAQTQFCLSLCGILRACSLEQPKLKTENAKCWQGCQATVTIKHCLCVKQWLCNGV